MAKPSNDDPEAMKRETADRAKDKVDEATDIGGVLRSAFRKTVDEKIPDEMLDLLRRLN